MVFLLTTVKERTICVWATFYFIYLFFQYSQWALIGGSHDTITINFIRITLKFNTKNIRAAFSENAYISIAIFKKIIIGAFDRLNDGSFDYEDFYFFYLISFDLLQVFLLLLLSKNSILSAGFIFAHYAMNIKTLYSTIKNLDVTISFVGNLTRCVELLVEKPGLSLRNEESIYVYKLGMNVVMSSWWMWVITMIIWELKGEKYNDKGESLHEIEENELLDLLETSGTNKEKGNGSAFIEEWNSEKRHQKKENDSKNDMGSFNEDEASKERSRINKWTYVKTREELEELRKNTNVDMNENNKIVNEEESVNQTNENDEIIEKIKPEISAANWE